MISILVAAILAQANTVQLLDEGVPLGPVRRLNCVGAGIVCTLAATGSVTGIITVSGGGGGGSGTVTSVSVVTANGVSGSVATATTTPAITLTLGAITPSSVASAGSVSGSNLSGTNTGDQTKTCTSQFVRTLAAGTSSTCASVAVADHSATGTPDSTTFLRGDNTWAAPPGGGGTSPLILSFGAQRGSALLRVSRSSRSARGSRRKRPNGGRRSIVSSPSCRTRALPEAVLFRDCHPTPNLEGRADDASA